MRRHAGTALAVAVVLTAVAACGDQDVSQSPGTPTPTSASPTSSASGLAQTCTSRADGFAVDYPSGWHVNDTDEHEPCRWFHPKPFELPRAQEVTGIAISLRFVSPTFDTVKKLEREYAETVITQQDVEVDGRSAVRLQLRASGEALLPKGTDVTTWLVDFDTRTMLANTTELAKAGGYEDNVKVLDRMMRSLRTVETPQGTCSAQGLPGELEPQPRLPQPVQDKREAIYAAAATCDFDRLRRLLPERGFTYSFGGGDNPIGAWQRAERRDAKHPPMRYLAGLLQRPYGTRQVEGRTQYEWPSAFGYEKWSDVPQRDREALKPLYDEEDFAGFEQFGGYIGYRVIITASGTWTAFVAGD